VTAPTQTGTTQYFSSSAKNNNFGTITVPADANFALLFLSYWKSGAPTLATVTLNGSNFSVAINSGDDGYEESTIYYIANPTTGSLICNWANAPDDGAHFFLVFLKDVNTTAPITGTATVSDPNTTMITGSFNTSIDDLCFVVGSNYNATAANAGVSGQTELYDAGTYNLTYGVIGYKSGVSGTTTMSVDWTGSGMAGSLCAVSIAGSTGTTHNLTANNITTGSPSIGTPSIGQTHVLPASNIAAGLPNLGSPSIGQTHVLSVDSLVTSFPDLGGPLLGEIHTLLGLDIYTLSSTVETTLLTQTHLLDSNNVISGIPVITQPLISQSHILIANDIVTGNSLVGNPELSQGFDLVANNIYTLPSETGFPLFGQTHLLISNDIVTGSPSLSAPELLEEFQLIADSIFSGVPDVGLPALTQIHVLDSLNIITEYPSLDLPQLAQEHLLIALSILVENPMLGLPSLFETTDITGIGRTKIIRSDKLVFLQSNSIRTILAEKINTIIKE